MDKMGDLLLIVQYAHKNCTTVTAVALREIIIIHVQQSIHYLSRPQLCPVSFQPYLSLRTKIIIFCWPYTHNNIMHTRRRPGGFNATGPR
jgi:hypothetical protein